MTVLSTPALMASRKRDRPQGVLQLPQQHHPAADLMSDEELRRLFVLASECKRFHGNLSTLSRGKQAVVDHATNRAFAR
jgi:hypothetical protein